MLIDSHCHLDQLNLTAYEGSLQAALEAADEKHVTHFLTVCTTLLDFPDVLHIARTNVNVFASFGIHPSEAMPEELTVAELVRFANSDPCVIAIGETGLDYHYNEGDLGWQRERFRRHIRASRETGKPLIIHTRDARDDTLLIMQEENASEIGGVMHCFTDTWDMAEQALAMGFYISISGIVTFKNAKAVQEVAQRVPLNRLLIETDAPYLAPDPYRGKPNEPAYLIKTAEFVAKLREISLDELAAATTHNFFECFKIK